MKYSGVSRISSRGPSPSVLPTFPLLSQFSISPSFLSPFLLPYFLTSSPFPAPFLPCGSGRAPVFEGLGYYPLKHATVKIRKTWYTVSDPTKIRAVQDFTAPRTISAKKFHVEYAISIKTGWQTASINFLLDWHGLRVSIILNPTELKKTYSSYIR